MGDISGSSHISFSPIAIFKTKVNILNSGGTVIDRGIEFQFRSDIAGTEIAGIAEISGKGSNIGRSSINTERDDADSLVEIPYTIINIGSCSVYAIT